MTCTTVDHTLQSVLARSEDYLSKLEVDATFRHEIEKTPKMQLRDITAMVGISGAKGALIAFSFDRPLAEKLTEVMTHSFKLADDEYEEMLTETVLEATNTIVGHCTADLSLDGETIAITPPVVITSLASVHTAKDSPFRRLTADTPYGRMDITIAIPAGSRTLSETER